MRVAAFLKLLGKALGDEVVNNHWIPDGAKDHPADRWTPRERLVEALDTVFDDGLGIGPECVDAVEGKLFGLGMGGLYGWVPMIFTPITR